MGKNTKIEWCNRTFNPWIGCTKVSNGCGNCYAERFGKWFGVEWGPDRARKLTSAANWRQPRSWDRKAAAEGRRLRVFCASLADVFDPEVPDDWRDRAFAVMALTPNLDWLVLTKRPERMRAYVTGHNGTRAVRGFIGRAGRKNDPAFPALNWPLPNVWLGVSVENQATADERVPILLDTPAALRFVSAEPLLGPLNLTALDTRLGGCSPVSMDALAGQVWIPGNAMESSRTIRGRHLDWIICGGESGPGARPCHPDWVRSLRDQCDEAQVPFFFKQWGRWRPQQADDETPTTRAWSLFYPNGMADIPDGRWPEFANGEIWVDPVGKAAAGHLLDGREHREMPDHA